MAYRTAAQNLPPTGMAAASCVGIWAALFTCMPSKHTAGAQQGMQTGLCCKAELTPKPWQTGYPRQGQGQCHRPVHVDSTEGEGRQGVC